MNIHPNHPVILLGTAMWGWTTTRETAFALLDEWYRQGFREVDTATNYPIDKNSQHFRMAEQILLDWIQAHGVSDLQVMMKVGSVNNLYTPEHVLTQSFMLLMLDEYLYKFGTNLSTLMVHWDNREAESEIRDTLEALEIARDRGLRTGLSGIRHPELYAMLNKEFNLDFRIQIKHNLLYSDYHRYAPFHGKRRFIAYGTNAGGLKLDPAAYAASSSLKARGGDVTREPEIMDVIRPLIEQANNHTGRPPISAFHQLGMIYSWYHPEMQGILLGASSVKQLGAGIDFYRVLQRVDYSDLYQAVIGKVDKNG